MFQIMSDLHFEYNPAPNARHSLPITESLPKLETLPVTAEILVLAGDLHNAQIARILSAFAAKWRLVLFVPGNHEYYGERFKYQHERFGRLERTHPNLKILLNELYTDPVSGIRFAGTTLWFPGNSETYSRTNLLNDFKCIKESPQIYGANITANRFLRDAVLENDKADVVITHHAPSKLCVKGEYEGDPANCYYVDPILDHPVLDCKAKIWIHGHTHVSHDFVHPSGTRVIANCGGYEWDVPGFDPGRVYTL